MNNIVLQKTWVQGRPVVVDNLLGTAFTGEAGAHTFKISGVDAAQETVTISGTITGKLLAANNVTISLSGSIEDGCAVVTLTDECYDVPGRFIFSVYATSGDTTLCLYCAVGNVLRTDSQVIAYPTESLPNITSLMADLEQILADWPADYSQLQSDVSSLKSALTLIEYTNQSSGLTFEKNKYVNAGTGEISSNTSKTPYAVSGIPVEGNAFVLKLESCEVAGVRGFAFYDSNGDFIQNGGYGYTIGQTIYFAPVPSNAKTMAITAFGSDYVFSVRFVYYQPTDKTLLKSDAPADAKATGDAIEAVNDKADDNTAFINQIENSFEISKNTYSDTPDRGVSAHNAGIILTDANDRCSLELTPLFSSTTNPYTQAASGTFVVRMYAITRSNGTVTLGDQIGTDTTYNVGDTINVQYFDGNMLLAIREAKDASNNILNLAYARTGKTWGNTLVSFSNTATTATVFDAYGIGGTCVVAHTSVITDDKIKNVLNGKSITVIGDSITEHNYRAKTNWAMWIEEWTGADFQNLGVSGSGFVRSSPYINRISQIQESPDIIGIAMSWNDLSANVGLPVGQPDDTGTASIAGYVNDFFTALITAYPTTPIIAYIQNPWDVYKPGVTVSDEYIEVMTELLANQGIPFIKDMYYGSALRPWNTANQNVYFKVDTETSEYYGETDGTHPNSEGHKVIARHLLSGFETNIVSADANDVID